MVRSPIRLFSAILVLLCFLCACGSESAAETLDTTVPSSAPAEPVTTETSTVPVETEPPTTETTAPPTTEETQPEVYVPWYETSRLIYHAGGAAGGQSYTNSKEAIEETLQRGDRLLEIDFLFTSDGHLVCLHEWKNLQGLTRPCTLEKFLSLKIYYQYTTITAETILAYMRDYPDMYLIIDTKERSSMDVVAELLRLCEHDPDIADRFVIQLYDKGLKVQMLELYPFPADNFLFTAYKFGPSRITDILNLCAEEEIRIVTVPYGSWDQKAVQRFLDAGCIIFEHTINDVKMASKGLSRGIYGFYTDSLLMEDLAIPES